MFTVCPKCALTLVVTAADLRVAQGYVRCGRCSNVFNALARLSEDREAAAAAAAQSQLAAHREAAPAPPRAAPKPAEPAPQPSDALHPASTAATPPSDFGVVTSASSLRLQQLADALPDPRPQPEPPGAAQSASTEPTEGGEDNIPDDALEFNP